MTLTPYEAALAGLLHDIGKLAQRARPDEGELRRAYAEAGRDLAGTETAILPRGRDGRYTHRHALWSDFFFLLAGRDGARWPQGVEAARVEAVAVRHHNPRPDSPADWILAEADRLASGLERKARDEGREAEAVQQPFSFREVELHALLPGLDIGRGRLPGQPLRHPAEEISAEGLPPRPPAPAGQPDRFGALWRAWCLGFAEIARHVGLSPGRFEQALLGLSERLLWAVPSSTVDQPDVSLHDHDRAVAAIAAALAAWHAAHGAMEVRAVKDRATPKFRLLMLDLSGIQDALLRLGGRRGASRVLRGRSFLMGETVSAALHLLLDRLGLPFSSVLLNAGGKAELLAPDLPDLAARLEAAREELDRCMIAHWQGDLALVLAAGPAFAAAQFLRRGARQEVAEGYREERGKLARALEAAKQRPFAGWRGGGFTGTGVIAAPFDAEGPCATCGVRPAVLRTALDGERRCVVCDAAYRIGQHLPKARGYALLRADSGEQDAPAALPGGLRLAPWPERGAAALASIAFDREGLGSAVPRPAAHVPLLGDPDDPRYRHAGLDAADEERVAKGELMTFGHIAAEALEVVAEGGRERILGRDLLGVVKADVDFLGRVFAEGLGGDRSPARVAQLSRMMDGYFARRLPWLLRGEFPTTYTVYAGGDDLLLIAPWRFALPLALRLREDFAGFAGGNPNLTLSAGIAFVHAKHPLALAVEEADAALDQAKGEGRDRLGVFRRTLGWDRLAATLELAEALNGAVRGGGLPPTFLHRARLFAGRRAAFENGDSRCADWNPKWRYHEARFLERMAADRREALRGLLLRALPPPGQVADADAEIAMTIALWRNR